MGNIVEDDHDRGSHDVYTFWVLFCHVVYEINISVSSGLRRLTILLGMQRMVGVIDDLAKQRWSCRK